MKYKQILKQISLKENVSVKEVEAEMKKALVAAGVNCSVKKFIRQAANRIAKDYI